MVIIILITLLICIILLHYLHTKTFLIENLANENESDTEDESDTENESDTKKNSYQDYDNLKNNQTDGAHFLALKNAANIYVLHSLIS